MKRRLLAGLVPAALALSGPVHADIYAFVDSNGVRHLSNVPNDPRYKLVMRTPAYSKASARPSSYAPSNLYAPGATALSPRNYTPRIAGARSFRVNEQNRQRFAAEHARCRSFAPCACSGHAADLGSLSADHSRWHN